MRALNLQLHMLGLRVLQGFTGVIDRRMGDILRWQALEPLRSCAGDEKGAQQLNQNRMMMNTRLTRCETLIFENVGALERSG